ncbi:MAG: phenylalanine--tRNA ligase subunit alpha [Proteobacteria bacterium]|nr:phenylalanine--tRNA ligase subunit alpha [Pseudomonadota bacterium]MBI3498280.1 phenylalanine--tRNA ligase subunit alpha [Pseudomonadota bacterium]
MKQQVEEAKAELLAMVAEAGGLDALEAVRVAALGRKGRITQLMKGLGGLEPDARREAGQALNELKDQIAEALAKRQAALHGQALQSKLAQERVDVSLPARPASIGRLHPLSQTLEELIQIFGAMGFTVAEGPDIDDDFHNFTALNIGPHHPARQMMDTFYLPPNKVDGPPMVLRTHTSTVQIRTMTTVKPPIRIIVPGRVYRSDSDATHSPMFHQVEGLVLDESTHLGHLKGCLTDFLRAFFAMEDLPVRFRPSYFPFTEPSAEVDIGCSRKGGELKLGAGGDWLEILGSGMVHPKVIANCGLDPARYQGFAFGMGIDRIAMLKYGIPDIRSFFDADLRWLRQYGFVPLDPPSVPGGLAR